MRALQARATREGFDWPDLDAVFAKVEEELAELRAAVADGESGAVEEEFGDVLLVLGRLALALDLDPERALGGARRKFARRYRRYRALLAETRGGSGAPDPAAIQALWDRVKAEERRAAGGRARG